MLHPHRTGHPALAGRPEHLGEVVGLAGVDDVEGKIGAQLLGPVPDGGDVGGGVQVAPGAADQDQRGVVAIVAGLVDPHDQGALRLLGGPRLDQPVHQRLQQVGHVRLAVPDVEVDSEVGEVLLLRDERDGAHVLPQRQVSGAPALEVDRGPAGGGGELLVGGRPGAGRRVDLLQILQADG